MIRSMLAGLVALAAIAWFAPFSLTFLALTAYVAALTTLIIKEPTNV